MERTVNPQAVTFYRVYFQEMVDQGIEPIINLFHFDMPWWLMERGGWEARESVDYFAAYARIAFEQFGDIVKNGPHSTEPLVHIECGYMGMPIGLKFIIFKRAIQVGYHTLLAHAKAVAAFRELAILTRDSDYLKFIARLSEKSAVCLILKLLNGQTYSIFAAF